MQAALAENPILTSFCVVDQAQDLYYATVKPSQRLWDLCILNHGTVATCEDVRQLTLQYPHSEKAHMPGPLFHCLITHVEETNSAALIIYCKCYLYTILLQYLVHVTGYVNFHLHYTILSMMRPHFRSSTRLSSDISQIQPQSFITTPHTKLGLSHSKTLANLPPQMPQSTSTSNYSQICIFTRMLCILQLNIPANRPKKAPKDYTLLLALQILPR